MSSPLLLPLPPSLALPDREGAMAKKRRKPILSIEGPKLKGPTLRLRGPRVVPPKLKVRWLGKKRKLRLLA